MPSWACKCRTIRQPISKTRSCVRAPGGGTLRPMQQTSQPSPDIRCTPIHAPAALNTVLRQLAGQLLTKHTVDAVLGWRQGSWEIRPFWATTPKETRHLLANGLGYPNLAAHLINNNERRIAVALRPAEARSVAELIANGRIAREKLFLIGIRTTAAGFDAVINPVAPEDTFPSAAENAATMAQWPAARRAAFWAAEFAQCIQCSACCDACPMYCAAQDQTRPETDAHTPQWVSSTYEMMAQHLAKTAWLARGCADCHACALSCPQGIPLELLRAQAVSALTRAPLMP